MISNCCSKIKLFIATLSLIVIIGCGSVQTVDLKADHLIYNDLLRSCEITNGELHINSDVKLKD